jgi:hypothetical protein
MVSSTVDVQSRRMIRGPGAELLAQPPPQSSMVLFERRYN